MKGNQKEKLITGKEINGKMGLIDSNGAMKYILETSVLKNEKTLLRDFKVLT